MTMTTWETMMTMTTWDTKMTKMTTLNTKSLNLPIFHQSLASDKVPFKSNCNSASATYDKNMIVDST